tara:strand:+ start:692 stop:1036 length:345 start_codon:yes stop_codon:yes gene_type:complete
MCEKNFEGKIMSDSSGGDIDETLPKDWEPVKKTKKKKRSKHKHCKTCGEDILENEKRVTYQYMDTYAQLRAKEYCEDHERTYGDHKCKPSWCGDCGYLTKYEIIVDWDKKKKNW